MKQMQQLNVMRCITTHPKSVVAFDSPLLSSQSKPKHKNNTRIHLNLRIWFCTVTNFEYIFRKHLHSLMHAIQNTKKQLRSLIMESQAVIHTAREPHETAEKTARSNRFENELQIPFIEMSVCVVRQMMVGATMSIERIELNVFVAWKFYAWPWLFALIHHYMCLGCCTLVSFCVAEWKALAA